MIGSLLALFAAGLALKGLAAGLVHLFGGLTAYLNLLGFAAIVLVVNAVGRFTADGHRFVYMAVVHRVGRAFTSGTEGLAAGLLQLGGIRTADLNLGTAAAAVAVAHAVDYTTIQLRHQKHLFTNFIGLRAGQ